MSKIVDWDSHNGRHLKLRSPSAVNLPARQRDRLLIDRSRVPALDRGKVRLPRLLGRNR